MGIMTGTILKERVEDTRPNRKRLSSNKENNGSHEFLNLALQQTPKHKKKTSLSKLSLKDNKVFFPTHKKKTSFDAKTTESDTKNNEKQKPFPNLMNSDQFSLVDLECTEKLSGSKQIEKKKKGVDATKYKTEMCKNWIDLGYCNYGKKCRFAHGEDELSKKKVIYFTLI